MSTRDPAWITRRTKRRLAPKKSIYIRVLGAYIDIDESVLQCGVCKELLPSDFVTLECHHSTCMDCIKKCVVDAEFACPTCRQTTKHLNYKDPILYSVLRTYPRVAPCGAPCDGCDAFAEHTKSCIGCATSKQTDLQAEYDALKKHTNAVMTDFTTLEESNALVRHELGRYVDTYGALDNAADESSTDDGAGEDS
jgi:hypothetical protein